MMRQLERLVMLHVIDRLWVDHLTAIDDLREGIGLRAYGQRDPLVEYKARSLSDVPGTARPPSSTISSKPIYHATFVREAARPRSSAG